MRRSSGVILALLAGIALRAAGQTPPADTLPSAPFAAGSVHQHDSQILGERRTYYVYLPPSYADTSFGARRFPVIYVLDAPVVWQYVSSTHNLLVTWGYQWPQAIVVGVRSPQRARDFTPTDDGLWGWDEVTSQRPEMGGAPRFLRYLEEELIPTIERRYRTTSPRTLVGHSLGGLFALYGLAERPTLFRNYMVLDPVTWRSGGMVERTVPETLRSGVPAPVAIFLGSAATVPAGPLAALSQKWSASRTRLASALAGLRSERVRVEIRHYADEEHTPMLVPATHHALRWFFGGPIIPESLLANVAALETRTRTLSRTLGIDSVPDPHEVSLAAADALDTPSGRPVALALLQLNARSFPRHSRAHQELGLALLVAGDSARARASLREALRLAPQDTVIARRLREIGG